MTQGTPPPPPRGIELVDVTLRDGLQLLPGIVPFADKTMLMGLLAAAGIGRLEIGSFVNMRLMPQFGDTPRMIAAARQHAGLKSAVLIPNRRGFDLALEHRPDEVVVVISASEAHNLANIRRTVSESLAEMCPMFAEARAQGIHVRLAVATAFHCPFAGPVAHDLVFAVVDEAVATGSCTEIVLADTIGHAFPQEVAELVGAALRRYPGLKIGLHAHDTKGRGVANAMAAVAVGVTVLDGAQAGLGGCPFAPGAAGNVATGDLAAALEAAGMVTGIDRQAMELASTLASSFGPPRCVPSLPERSP